MRRLKPGFRTDSGRIQGWKFKDSAIGRRSINTRLKESIFHPCSSLLRRAAPQMTHRVRGASTWIRVLWPACKTNFRARDPVAFRKVIICFAGVWVGSLGSYRCVSRIRRALAPVTRFRVTCTPLLR